MLKDSLFSIKREGASLSCGAVVLDARGGIEPSLDFFRAFFEINIFVFIIVSRVV